MKIPHGTSNHKSGLTSVRRRGQGTYENGGASMGAPTLVDHLQCVGSTAQSRRDCSAHGSLSHNRAISVIARYNRLGPVTIEQSEKGGRRHGYLTVEQEQAFLQPFFARAERGEIATVEQIQQVLEEQV